MSECVYTCACVGVCVCVSVFINNNNIKRLKWSS